MSLEAPDSTDTLIATVHTQAGEDTYHEMHTHLH